MDRVLILHNYLYLLGKFMKLSPENFTDQDVIEALGIRLREMSRINNEQLEGLCEKLTENIEKIKKQREIKVRE